MKVSEAKQDDVVEIGHVYIAPGSHHLELVRKGSGYICGIHEGPAVSGHRPSVDVLFRSGAKIAGPKIVSAILTGMGKDGAQGMLELHKAGAATIGQDEHSSLIYGMPRAAFELGGVQTQVSLDHVAGAILDACSAKAPLKHHAG